MSEMDTYGAADYISFESHENMRRQDRQTIAELEARVQELEEWKRIIEGTGTDQEAVIRMAATEYTKVAVQCWKDKVQELEDELTRLKGRIAVDEDSHL